MTFTLASLYIFGITFSAKYLRLGRRFNRYALHVCCIACDDMVSNSLQITCSLSNHRIRILTNGRFTASGRWQLNLYLPSVMCQSCKHGLEIWRKKWNLFGFRYQYHNMCIILVSWVEILRFICATSPALFWFVVRFRNQIFPTFWLVFWLSHFQLFSFKFYSIFMR